MEAVLIQCVIAFFGFRWEEYQLQIAVDLLLSKNAYLHRTPTVGGVLSIKGIFQYFRLSYKSRALLVSVHFDWFGAIQHQDCIYWFFCGISHSHKCETLSCHKKGNSALLKGYVTFRFLRSTHKIYVGLRIINNFAFSSNIFVFQIERWNCILVHETC